MWCNGEYTCWFGQHAIFSAIMINHCHHITIITIIITTQPLMCLIWFTWLTWLISWSKRVTPEEPHVISIATLYWDHRRNSKHTWSNLLIPPIPIPIENPHPLNFNRFVVLIPIYQRSKLPRVKLHNFSKSLYHAIAGWPMWAVKNICIPSHHTSWLKTKNPYDDLSWVPQN